MFVLSTRASWAVLPLLLFVFTMTGCGSKDSTPTASTSTAPSVVVSSSAPIAAASASPAATSTAMSSSSPLPAGETAMGSRPENGSCSQDRPIKGNIGKRGKIYHLPNSQGYAEVKPEACFATTADAEQAGFRAPKASADKSQKTP